MNKVLMVIAASATLSSGFAQAQYVGGNTNGGRDMATASNMADVSEGFKTPSNQHTLAENHMQGVQRGRMCAVEARRMLSKLDKANYADAQRSFSPSVRKLVSPDHLKTMWTSLESSYGASSKSYGRSTLIDSPAGGYSVIAMDVAYPQAKLTVHVMCDLNNKLTDFKVTKDDQIASK